MRLLGAVVLFCLATSLAATMAIPAGAVTLHDKLTRTPHIFQTPRPGAKATNRWCFWRQDNGTSFGKSGFCDAAMDSPIGSACTCHGGGPKGGRQPDTYAGKVIEAPQGTGAPSSVH